MNATLPLADELAVITARLAGRLLTEETASTAVQSLAYVLKDAIPNSAGAGASIMDARGRKVSAGATDPVVLAADKLQYELGQGPCLSAWAEQRTVTIEDMREETRWPQWVSRLGGLPIRSVMSAPLTAAGRRIGAFKVYSPSAHAFDEGSRMLLQRLTLPATVMLSSAIDRESTRHLSSELVEALTHRDAIRRAEGMLMERMNLTSSEASAVILSIARGEGKPLHVAAREIVGGVEND